MKSDAIFYPEMFAIVELILTMFGLKIRQQSKLIKIINSIAYYYFWIDAIYILIHHIFIQFFPHLIVYYSVYLIAFLSKLFKNFFKLNLLVILILFFIWKIWKAESFSLRLIFVKVITIALLHDEETNVTSVRMSQKSKKLD